LKRSKSKDHYKTLGVRRNAVDTDIKKAFKKAALKCHPDKVQGEAEKEVAEKKFKEINEAAMRRHFSRRFHAVFTPFSRRFHAISRHFYRNFTANLNLLTACRLTSAYQTLRSGGSTTWGAI